MINRAALIVRAKQPFLDWLVNMTDLEAGSVTLDSLNKDPNVYLIAEYENDQEFQQVLNDFFETIFERELYSWWQDSGDWPSDRNFEMFKNWFEIQSHSIIEDLVHGPIDNQGDLID